MGSNPVWVTKLKITRYQNTGLPVKNGKSEFFLLFLTFYFKWEMWEFMVSQSNSNGNSAGFKKKATRQACGETRYLSAYRRDKVIVCIMSPMMLKAKKSSES